MRSFTNALNISETSSTKNLSVDACAIGICVLAASVACLFQIQGNDASRVTLAFDSGHYMGTAQLLVANWLGATHHASASALAAQYGFSADKLSKFMLVDGPLLPLLGAIAFGAFGKIPTGTEWQTFVAIESAFHVISTCLLYFLARSLTSSWRLGLAAGLCWALYPSAVIGCNTFMSEVPTAAVMLMFIYFLARLNDLAINHPSSSVRSVAYSLLAGVSGAVLLMTKPAFIFPIACAFNLFIWSVWKRKIVRIVLLMAVAFLVTEAPWMVYTHQVTGSILLSARRQPTMNAAKGSDPTTDGWGTVPPSYFEKRFSEQVGPAKAVLSIWREQPGESINLAARKTERLWESPWNDYRSKSLGLPLSAQIWWHRFLLLCGLFGLVAFVMCGAKNATADLIAKISIAFVAGHLAYVPFETLPRYGFTAMPLFVLFAAYLFSALSLQLSKFKLALLLVLGIAVAVLLSNDLFPFIAAFVAPGQSPDAVELSVRIGALLGLSIYAATLFAPLAASRKHQIAGFLTLTVLFGVCIASLLAHYVHDEELRDWRCTLKPGWSAVREVMVPKKRPDWALVLIDGDQTISRSQIRVNGELLHDHLSNLGLFAVQSYYLNSDLQLLCNLQNKDIDSMRQWRAVPVPLKLLKFGSVNAISVEPSGSLPVRIFGAYPPSCGTQISLPSLDKITLSKTYLYYDSLETRVADPNYTSPVDTTSYLKNGTAENKGDLSTDRGIQNGQYRIYMVLGYPTAFQSSSDSHRPVAVVANVPRTVKANPSLKEGASLKVVRKIGPADFGKTADSDGTGGLTVSVGAYAALPLPPSLTLSSSEHFKIRITGEDRAVTPASVFGVVVTSERAGDQALFISGAQLMTRPKSEWSPFEVAADAPVTAISGDSKKLGLRLIGTNGGVQVRHLTYSIEPVDLPSFRNHDVQIY